MTPQPDSTSTPAPPHMTPNQFRALGHRLVDWVADHHTQLQSTTPPPVTPDTTPGEVFSALPDRAPESPGDPNEWDAIIRDVDTLVVPHLQLWQHPAFFGYFPCNASFPAILGELVSAGLNVNGMLWATSPAATELEQRILDWCCRLFALPDHFLNTSPSGGGVIQGTASEATLVALLAARHRASAFAAPSAVLCSEGAHSSVAKAAMIAGVAASPDDAAHLRLVRTRPDGSMDPAHLADQLRETRDAGIRPLMVVASLGTTGTGAFDPVDQIARTLDQAEGDLPWLHVDAAWAGSALVCPEHRAMLAGIEHADSFCVNPHKWMLTNFDCDLFWTRDRDALVRALSITPEYLRNAATDTGGITDYRDWQIPLGRRLRALKLWFVLRHYGAEGLRAHIRQHVAWASDFESWVHAGDRFELALPRSLSMVTFRLQGDGSDADQRNKALLDRVNTRGEIFLSHTRAALPSDPSGEPRFVLRLAIGATHTRRAHVELAWRELEAAADALPPLH